MGAKSLSFKFLAEAVRLKLSPDVYDREDANRVVTFVGSPNPILVLNILRTFEDAPDIPIEGNLAPVTLELGPPNGVNDSVLNIYPGAGGGFRLNQALTMYRGANPHTIHIHPEPKP